MLARTLALGALIGVFAARADAGRIGPLEAHHHHRGNPSRLTTVESVLQGTSNDPAELKFLHGHLGMLLTRDELFRLQPSRNHIPGHGLLYPTAYHRFLHRLQNLNPQRFDQDHPILGALLNEDNRLQHDDIPPVLTLPPQPPGDNPPGGNPPGGNPPGGNPPGGNPPGGNPPGPHNPEPPNPPATPEPGGLTLLATAAVVLAAWRSKRRRQGKAAGA